MGCPANSKIFYGIEIKYDEDELYELEEEGKIESCPYFIFRCGNEYGDEPEINVIEVQDISDVCNCTAVKVLNPSSLKLNEKKAAKAIAWVKKNLKGSPKVKLYHTCDYN